jgi:hypothetical protein
LREAHYFALGHINHKIGFPFPLGKGLGVRFLESSRMPATENESQ